MTSPWLRNDPAPDYARMTLAELLALEGAHVNEQEGHCAAHEVCNRLRRAAQDAPGSRYVSGEQRVVV